MQRASIGLTPTFMPNSFSIQGFENGLLKVKEVCRWLLGRGEENYWNWFQEDDREFDANDDHVAAKCSILSSKNTKKHLTGKDTARITGEVRFVPSQTWI